LYQFYFGSPLGDQDRTEHNFTAIGRVTLVFKNKSTEIILEDMSQTNGR